MLRSFCSTSLSTASVPVAAAFRLMIWLAGSLSCRIVPLAYTSPLPLVLSLPSVPPRPAIFSA